MARARRSSDGLWARIDKRWKSAAGNGEAFDWRPLWVLVLVSVVLTGLEYYGDRWHYAQYFSSRARGENAQLESLALTAACSGWAARA